MDGFLPLFEFLPASDSQIEAFPNLYKKKDLCRELGEKLVDYKDLFVNLLFLKLLSVSN